MAIANICGNTTGLKPSEIRGLERIYRRRIPIDKVITPELARYLTELSLEIGRQIGILITRRGFIAYVIVGDEKGIVIPELSDFRLGRKRLRGVRLIHTHLKDEPLSHEDLTDLALLRLDFIASVGVLENGLPGSISVAYLLPPNLQEKLYEVMPSVPLHSFELNVDEFVSALEDEFESTHSGIDIKDQRERAILVSVSMKSRIEQEESIEELRELARSDDVVVIDTVVQRPHEIHHRYLMGEGKIKELIIKALQKGATLIIFDQNLTPTQVKSLGEITELKVIDRTQLILDIFTRRAHSRDGKIQVELAQLKYMLPRLSERSTALSRLTGGIGGRGPGETTLEVDRRRVRDKIAHLEKELKELSKGRKQRKSRRIQSGIPILSIVGYTNAGKSTLLNSLTESSVRTENLLFATLDTSSRRLRFPRERDVIITDTVGFIKDIPEDLLGAFRPTLDELQDANLLIHVVDISSPNFEQHIDTVNRLLVRLKLDHIPQILIFNKEDLVDELFARNVCRQYGGVSISAIKKETLRRLITAIEERLWGYGEEITLMDRVRVAM